MIRSRFALGLAVAVCVAAVPAFAASKPKAAAGKTAAGPDSLFRSSTFSGLKFRSVGPALVSGRVIDIAINPQDEATWFVAAASGGVWKTTNAGTTWKPVFDSQGSYSIGCVAIDPKNPLVVWVGSGENNSQRSVAYGDGVYKSIDGGNTWKNVGLKGSEHIGKILVDPRNSDVVYVAAQGPLWNTGGERGLYKSTDGGKTWTQSLKIDDKTGVSDLAFDPRDPDVIYASAYERHRRVWTLIDGGPGSALYKSTDAGKTWNKLSNGLPSAEMGRIGIAVSPADPNTVYAICEAVDGEGGIYRTQDAGATWEKRAGYMSSSPQYYNELICDPKNVDRVYSMDTFMKVSQDGGKTWTNVGERSKHVDNHALWIDPDDTDHLRAGCDGGAYESYDRGATWSFFANLPITQFYKVAVDTEAPYYNIYGGTQDNNTLGGPSRTITENGGRNQDWFITTGGDGFAVQIDPQDPNIVYCEAQDGELVRFDKKNGETVALQPQPEPGDAPQRWDWDTPLLISPHSHTRLYYASQQLWRSDDRGDSWVKVSPDLTRQIERNKLKVAGRVWGVNTNGKNASTSWYGNIVSLSESPKVEGLLYVGTDDGLIQVSEDGGKTWRKQDTFPGVPTLSYVSEVLASQHDANVVYAAFENHKEGDFKPYVLRSNDRGRTWTALTSGLPERGSVYCLAEDHVDAKLLFCGTEFGCFATVTGGAKWFQLKGGLPTIQVRDMVIQPRENDLVLATFGRGFYVLDDYSPLRGLTAATLEKPVVTFPAKTALMYVPWSPIGGSGKSQQGDGFFVSPNPPFGAILTYYRRDGLKSRRDARREKEKEVWEKGGDVFYPSWDSLAAEDRAEDPTMMVTIMDADMNVVRRFPASAGGGFTRVAWDLRYPVPNPTTIGQREDRLFFNPYVGPMVAPGKYTALFATRIDDKLTPVGDPVTFECVPLANASLPAKDRAAVLAFQQKTARLQRAVLGAERVVDTTAERISYVKQAIDDAPGASRTLRDDARALELRLLDIRTQLDGDPVKGSRNEPVGPGISARVQRIVDSHWLTTGEAPKTSMRDYEIASAAFAPTLAALRQIVEVELPALEKKLDAAGAAWTPGRFPEWKPE